MTWEVASFLIVGAVILAGFAWYERSRPPAQVVALVAALAALAIAGRIAFAAFPNVKPTTDIVVFAGYALGGAPGFAVGALTALVSNFWFGQGPWTPWQMVGWGLCGVFGALCALGTRNAGRLTLAAICGFAGIFYGALLNFSLMATYGGDLSWRHFLVLEARAIPFDVAHVLGNVVLALVAGPAMVRMLVRFRERFEWQRRAAPRAPGGDGSLRGALRSGGIAAALLLVACSAFAPAPAQAQSSSVTQALTWLEAQQRPSGGFAADSGRDAGAEMTSWAMLALAAAGRNPLDVTQAGKSPVDFLRAHRSEIEDAGDVARTILSLQAAGVDPRSFVGEDLVSRLLAERRDNGSYQGWPGTSAYAVLALRAAGANSSATATVEWLRKVQGKDGGWGNEPQSPGTADITGAVLQVLSPGSQATEDALAFLRKEKRPNGGFAPGKTLAANAQATAWVSQGLLAAGKDPAGFGTGASSLAYLRDLQEPDGKFLQAPSTEVSPVWVTAEAMIPLAGRFLPITAPPREPQPKQPKAKGDSQGSETATTPSTSSPITPQSSPALKEFLESTSDGDAGAQAPSPGGVSPSSPGQKGGDSVPGLGAVPGGVPGAGLGDVTGDLPESLPEAAGVQYGEQASEPVDGDSGSSGTAGAILLGLLAGCVLFGLGLAGRRGWMHWRYGL
ncbi:MAG TPA: prenyltransferase/squalene oxidase repeat-containing protein [Solirubrobacterales bacterium]|nr:prenyltransferase/squalene oxidase repeat-containing protein [Solirubrobacterales bacterium]